MYTSERSISGDNLEIYNELGELLATIPYIKGDDITNECHVCRYNHLCGSLFRETESFIDLCREMPPGMIIDFKKLGLEPHELSAVLKGTVVKKIVRKHNENIPSKHITKE